MQSMTTCKANSQTQVKKLIIANYIKDECNNKLINVAYCAHKQFQILN